MKGKILRLAPTVVNFYPIADRRTESEQFALLGLIYTEIPSVSWGEPPTMILVDNSGLLFHRKWTPNYELNNLVARNLPNKY